MLAHLKILHCFKIYLYEKGEITLFMLQAFSSSDSRGKRRPYKTKDIWSGKRKEEKEFVRERVEIH